MLGDSGIGKSCMVVRYAYNRFTDFEAPTIGAAYAAQRLKCVACTAQARVGTAPARVGTAQARASGSPLPWRHPLHPPTRTRTHTHARRLADGTQVELAIWDTSGQEKYNSLTAAFLRNALGAVIAYDITNRESFDHVDDTRIGWLKQFNRACPDGVAVLVGNKADLVERRQVPTADAADFAAKRGMKHHEVSAKTGDSVTAVFEDLAREIVAKQRAGKL